MAGLDLEVLRCPRSGAPLSRREDALVAGGFTYPVRRSGDREYVDFRVHELTDGTRARQSELYEREDDRYARDVQEPAKFISDFVQARAHGRVKSKERKLLDELRALRLAKGDRVLELGCNDGRYLDTLAAMFGTRGVGLDLSERAVRRALAGGEFAAPNDFHVGDCERLPFAEGAFRCVVAFDVFEHLGHAVLAKTLEECARVLAPGGVLLIYVISQRDRFTLHETVRRVSGSRLGHDDQDGHAYENFVSPALFRTLAMQAGLKVNGLDAYHGFWTLYGEEFLGNRPPGLVYRALEWLDYGLIKGEHGNGFFARASKERP